MNQVRVVVSLHVQEIKLALSVENVKTIIKLGRSASYYHHALAILNNVGDKTVLPKEIFLLVKVLNNCCGYCEF